MKHNIILMSDVEDHNKWQGVGRNYPSRRLVKKEKKRKERREKERKRSKVISPLFDVRSLIEALKAPDYKTAFFFMANVTEKRKGNLPKQ